MKLDSLQSLFDALGNVVDLQKSTPPTSSKSLASLVIGTLLNQIEEGAFESRSGAITRVAVALDKAEGLDRFEEGWTLDKSLKALRAAWYPDDFDTVKKISLQCWWALNYACKISDQLNREKP